MAVPQYLDPGSASILLQMITGGVVAFVVAVKVFWQRILAVLHLGPRERSDVPPEDDPDPRSR